VACSFLPSTVHRRWQMFTSVPFPTCTHCKTMDVPYSVRLDMVYSGPFLTENFVHCRARPGRRGNFGKPGRMLGRYCTEVLKYPHFGTEPKKLPRVQDLSSRSLKSKPLHLSYAHGEWSVINIPTVITNTESLVEIANERKSCKYPPSNCSLYTSNKGDPIVSETCTTLATA